MPPMKRACWLFRGFSHDPWLLFAVQVVGLAKNELMTHTLVDFLMGETDNVPKDPHYIFQLYMALGNYAQVRAVWGVML